MFLVLVQVKVFDKKILKKIKKIKKTKKSISTENVITRRDLGQNLHPDQEAEADQSH